MFVDNGGALWLSDPTLVLVLLAGAVALIVWCHRWMETGSMPVPRSMQQRVKARPALLANARSDQQVRRSLRTRSSGRHPRQAA